MNMRKNAKELAQEILSGENPLVVNPYAVQEELNNLGVFEYEDYKGKTIKIAKEYLRYRVYHGKGDITQNTWYIGQCTPEMKEI